MEVVLHSSNAKLPQRANVTDAGYDLFASEATLIKARGSGLVKTDISISIPYGTYARIAPRSGLAVKHGIDVGAGVCDYGYTGKVGVLLFNHSDNDFQVSIGDRVAQLILTVIMTPSVTEVKKLASTDRGTSGFGSTGK